jgi:tRNA (Thr-GGU) A37 N-methylase
MKKNSFEITSIGRIEVVEDQGVFRLNIDEPFRPALMGLGNWTHAIILWWADQCDSPGNRSSILVADLPYAPGVKSGIFANRSQIRPNPIAITTSFVLNVNEEDGIVDLAYIDAFDGTPLLDIKPYVPMSDRVLSAEYADWLEGFPESLEDAAEFFADPANAEMFS